MEQNTNVSFVYFDQALVQRVIDFTELGDEKKTKETVKTFSDEIKGGIACWSEIEQQNNQDGKTNQY